MKISTLILFALLLTACNQYTALGTKPVSIGSLTVDPTPEWSVVPAQARMLGAPTWTRNGTSLDSVTFLFDVEAGEVFSVGASRRAKEVLPTYEPDMLPDEIIEAFESTLAKQYQAKIIEKGGLKPVTLSIGQGFEYEFIYSSLDNVIRKANLFFIQKDQRLNVVFYQAARMHYYKNSEREVDQIIRSLAGA